MASRSEKLAVRLARHEIAAAFRHQIEVVPDRRQQIHHAEAAVGHERRLAVEVHEPAVRFAQVDRDAGVLAALRRLEAEIALQAGSLAETRRRSCQPRVRA